MLRRQSFSLSLCLLLTGIVLLSVLWLGCSETPQQPLNSSAPSLETLVGRGQALDEMNPRVQAVMDVQNKHTEKLLSDKDVIGTGTGLTENGQMAVLVFARNAAAIPRVPKSLDGVPTRVQVVGEVVAMGYKGTYRPVPGGVSVGNANECASGTIGCIVLKGGVRHVLSNNHVLARMNAGSNGERINQPGRYDAKPACGQTGQIGTLSGKVNINFSGGNNTVDAATALLTTDSNCSMVNGLYTPSTNTVSPSVGLAVKKVGRTSGLTSGSIAGINVTINVNYGSPGVAKFVNQIYVASNLIRSGDSGSLMVTQSGNNPVGLCFAGGQGASFANPIGPVLQGLGVSICGQ